MGETSINVGSAPHARSIHGPEAAAWPSPLLSSADPGGSYYRVLLNVTQLGAAPVDLTVWSALDPHTSTSVLASLSTVLYTVTAQWKVPLVPECHRSAETKPLFTSLAAGNSVGATTHQYRLLTIEIFLLGARDYNSRCDYTVRSPRAPFFFWPFSSTALPGHTHHWQRDKSQAHRWTPHQLLLRLAAGGRL